MLSLHASVVGIRVSKQNTLIGQRFPFRCVTAKNALHQNSAPVTTTTGHMHQDRPSLWTATPGKMIVCVHCSEEKYPPCACLTGCVVYSVCENRKWKCTERECDGVCRTVGEGHYISFDGLKYSFPGLCQYVLVQVRDGDIRKEKSGRNNAVCIIQFSTCSCQQDMCNGEEGSFRVLVENEACGIVGHRCAKAVTVFFQGGLIVMQDGEVTPTVHT